MKPVRLWALAVLADPDGTAPLRTVAVDSCRRCGHAAGLHRGQGFHPDERDQRCVTGCECRAFGEPWNRMLRDQAWGVLLGLIVGLMVLALIFAVLS